MNKKFLTLSVSLFSVLALSGCANSGDKGKDSSQSNDDKIVSLNKDNSKDSKSDNNEVSLNEKDMANGGSTTIEAKPLSYKPQKQMIMQPLDKYKRAVDSHIQVSKSELPKGKRPGQINYNPSGWHNYKVKDKDGKDYWAYNRGHLVGYQFCGLNDEPRNLVTETRTLNAGAGRGTDANNPISQLYYEQRLRDFVDKNPNDKLDLQVTPLYKGNELMPRSVRLSFVGYDKNGKEVKINIDSKNDFVKYKGNIGQVVLPNVEPTLDINYQTGQATILSHPNYNYVNNNSLSNNNIHFSHSFVPYWLGYKIYDEIRDSHRYRKILNAIDNNSKLNKVENSAKKAANEANKEENKGEKSVKNEANKENNKNKSLSEKIHSLKEPSHHEAHEAHEVHEAHVNHEAHIGGHAGGGHIGGGGHVGGGHVGGCHAK